MHIPLPDGANWTPIALETVPTLFAYRYGDDHLAVAAAVQLEGRTAAEASDCQRRMEQTAVSHLAHLGLRLTLDAMTRVPWHGREVQILHVQAHASEMGREPLYWGAMAAFPASERECIAVFVGVRGDIEHDHAWALRQRFADEVLPEVRLRPEVLLRTSGAVLERKNSTHGTAEIARENL